ncbi:hypothetical protein MMC21_002615 [Puttea exsequens]|nr:hypothetical protein [Puttea exsequens]
MADMPSIKPSDHQAYMRLALTEAKKAPPKSTNFCVGAVLIDETINSILSTGYTMELEGNTHAEQCCLMKYQGQRASLGDVNAASVPQKLVLYTSVEPCNKRASGNVPCIETILKTRSGPHHGVQIVYVGLKEPEKFVGENTGRTRLEEAGISYVHVPGYEKEILAVATAGHVK